MIDVLIFNASANALAPSAPICLHWLFLNYGSRSLIEISENIEIKLEILTENGCKKVIEWIRTHQAKYYEKYLLMMISKVLPLNFKFAYNIILSYLDIGFIFDINKSNYLVKKMLE